jgi:hypothetical protein
MNTSSRVPGVSRNSGWQTVDLEIASRRVSQPQTQIVHAEPAGK